MQLYHKIKSKVGEYLKAVRFHLLETDDVLIYWPDYYKGILLLIFALCILLGHLSWYVLNYQSSNHIWFSETYHDYRMFTTWMQVFLTACVLIIALAFKKYEKFKSFMGWFMPLYFGLLLLYSAKSVGLYSPAAIGGTLNILLIGFVFYKPKVIYSIMVVVAIYFVSMCLMTANGALAYAPLFSDQLNQSDLYKNTFWLKSMVVLYSPILIVSALFFELLLRQWRRRESKIETLSQIDSLTEVYNRRFLTSFTQKLQIKQSFHYAMIILDLDYFKKINDQYGHDAGDQVLISVAQILKKSVRVQDVVGRLGGEEFALILVDRNMQQAIEVAERCREEIAQSNMELADHTILKVTASFGVAVAQQGMNMDEVTHQADRALYLAKEKGRNQVQFYQD